MQKELEELNINNTKEETQIADELKKVGKYEIAVKAKNEAVQNFVLKNNGAIYYTIYPYQGEQIEPITDFIFYCERVSSSAGTTFQLQYPNSFGKKR